MKIYLDLFIFQEVVITSFILFLLAKLLNVKVKIIRILCVAFLNGIALSFVLVFFPRFYNSFILKVASSFVVLKFGLDLRLREDLFFKISSLWFLTFLLGGIGFLSEGNLLYMLVLFLFLGFAILKYKAKYKKVLYLDAATCFVGFKYEGVSYNFKALVDTGHDVKSIYDEDIIFVKEDLFKVKKGGKNSNRIVRYKTVSGTEEKTGIKIYNISITYGQRKIFNNAVIVSTPNILNQFDAIIGLSLIEGGWFDGDSDFDKTESKEIVS